MIMMLPIPFIASTSSSLSFIYHRCTSSLLSSSSYSSSSSSPSSSSSSSSSSSNSHHHHKALFLKSPFDAIIFHQDGALISPPNSPMIWPICEWLGSLANFKKTDVKRVPKDSVFLRILFRIRVLKISQILWDV